MSEIQSVEGRPIKKGISPGQRSAYTALALLVGAVAILVVGQLIQPPPLPLDHELALLRSSGAVELALPDGTAATPLSGSGVPIDGTAIRWAPGGDFLAVRRDAELVIVDRAGVVAWRHTLRSPFSDFAWSPDGSRIAIDDAVDLGTVAEQGPIAGQVSVEIYTTTGALEWGVPVDPGFERIGGDGSLAWAPDGSSVAFTGLTQRVSEGLQWSSVWLAGIRGQTVRRLTSDTGTFDYGPVWTTGVGLVIGRMTTAGSSISTIDPANGAATELLRRPSELCGSGSSCAPVHLSPLVPSPDGRLIAFRDPRFGVSILNPATREIIKIPQEEVVPDVPYAWSEDGAFLYLQGHAAPTADPSHPGSLARFDVTARTLSLVIADVVSFDLLARPSSP
ncbi:MAG TPA: hypothetical protein VFP56_08050 [Candidatus Limnocylindrales bacterium]|nr:hypothetical protein [Candidatus Limnocylindrales bacterium]